MTGAHRVISGERPQDVEFAVSQDIESLKSTWKIGYFNGWDEHYFRLEQTQHRSVSPPYIYVFWEYKPTTDWSLHFELDNFGRFVYDNQYFDYDGDRRDTSPQSGQRSRIARLSRSRESLSMFAKRFEA